MWLWILAATASALQPTLTPAQLAAAADRVLVAEPTSREVRWAEGADGGLETLVWLAPLHPVKGALPDGLELRLPGGTLGEHSTWVEDVPDLPLDQPVLLFLKDTPDGWIVLGGEQGAVPVSLEPGQDGFALDQALAPLEVPDVP